jgi:hypothetical protein
VAESGIEGLWYIQATAEDNRSRHPLLARVGEDTYMLAFSNAPKARNFIQQMHVTQAEVGMIVRGNVEEVRNTLRNFGAAGVIIDYDPETQAFAAARAA